MFSGSPFSSVRITAPVYSSFPLVASSSGRKRARTSPRSGERNDGRLKRHETVIDVVHCGRVVSASAIPPAPESHANFHGQDDLSRIAERFRDAYSNETIEAVYRSALASFTDARITAYIPLLAARSTREQLLQAERASGPSELHEVVFVSHDSALAEVAAALLRRRLGDSVAIDVASPPLDVNQRALVAARFPGLDLRFEAKRLTSELVASASVVVTLRGGDSCPVVPGRRYLHWGLDAILDETAGSRHGMPDVEQRVERLAAALAAGRAP